MPVGNVNIFRTLAFLKLFENKLKKLNDTGTSTIEKLKKLSFANTQIGKMSAKKVKELKKEIPVRRRLRGFSAEAFTGLAGVTKQKGALNFFQAKQVPKGTITPPTPKPTKGTGVGTGTGTSTGTGVGTSTGVGTGTSTGVGTGACVAACAAGNYLPPFVPPPPKKQIKGIRGATRLKPEVVEERMAKRIEALGGVGGIALPMLTGKAKFTNLKPMQGQIAGFIAKIKVFGDTLKQDIGNKLISIAVSGGKSAIALKAFDTSAALVGKVGKGTFKAAALPFKALKGVKKGLGKSLGVAFSAMGKIPGADMAFSMIMDTLMQMISALNPFRPILETLVEIFEIWGDVLGSGFTPLIEALFDIMLSDAVMSSIDILTESFSIMALAMIPIIDAIMPALITVILIFAGVISAIAPLFEQLAPIFTILGQLVVSLLTAFAPLIIGLMPAFIIGIQAIAWVIYGASVAIIGMFNATIWVINGIISAVNLIPGVDLAKLAYASTATVAPPSFAVGSDRITRGGLAILHEGERIVTAESVGPYTGGSNEESIRKQDRIIVLLEDLNRKFDSIVDRRAF